MPSSDNNQTSVEASTEKFPSEAQKLAIYDIKRATTREELVRYVDAALKLIPLKNELDNICQSLVYMNLISKSLDETKIGNTNIDRKEIFEKTTAYQKLCQFYNNALTPSILKHRNPQGYTIGCGIVGLAVNGLIKTPEWLMENIRIIDWSTAVGSTSTSPLHILCSNKSCESLVQGLMDARVVLNWNLAHANGATPLALLALDNCWDKIRQLMKDPNTNLNWEKGYNQGEDKDRTVFFSACAARQWDIVQELMTVPSANLNWGEGPTEGRYKDKTPLFYVCASKQWDIAKQLISDPSIKHAWVKSVSKGRDAGKSPFWFACIDRQWEFVQAILNAHQGDLQLSARDLKDVDILKLLDYLKNKPALGHITITDIAPKFNQTLAEININNKELADPYRQANNLIIMLDDLDVFDDSPYDEIDQALSLLESQAIRHPKSDELLIRLLKVACKINLSDEELISLYQKYYRCQSDILKEHACYELASHFMGKEESDSEKSNDNIATALAFSYIALQVDLSGELFSKYKKLFGYICDQIIKDNGMPSDLLTEWEIPLTNATEFKKYLEINENIINQYLLIEYKKQISYSRQQKDIRAGISLTSQLLDDNVELTLKNQEQAETIAKAEHIMAEQKLEIERLRALLSQQKEGVQTQKTERTTIPGVQFHQTPSNNALSTKDITELKRQAVNSWFVKKI